MPFVLKYAVRRLANAPGSTIVAVVMLALGIAMSTSAFSVASSALLRPLPFPGPDRLVRVFTTSPRSANWPLAPANAVDVRDTLTPVGAFALFSFEQQAVARPGQPPELQSGLSVTSDFLRLLRIQPALGRDFLPDDDRRGQPAVVLLTNRFWRERFGADPAVLGQPLRIEGVDHTIIGVLPPTFDEPLVWSGCGYVTPLIVGSDWTTQRLTRWIHIVGRLDPGVGFAEVQTRLDALSARLARDYPIEMGATGLRVTALGPSFATDSVHAQYWLVVALSVAVLLIACANLGGVQLARALGRRGELAVRTALGATPRDLLTTLAAESIVIAALGTALGLALTYSIRSLISHAMGGADVPIDGRVLTFVVVAGGLAVGTFGLIPAWLGTRGAMAEAMKDSGRGATPGGPHQRFKRLLVIGQLALALVLVSAAASFVLGVRAFLQRDRGWQPAGLVAGALTIPGQLIGAERKDPVLPRRLTVDLGRIPGVESVAVASTVPLYGYQHPGPVVVEGADTAPGHEPIAFITGVNAGYFQTLGIRLVAGRLFAPEWRRTDPPVAIVSASTARRLFPDGSALGQWIRFAPDPTWHEIIGVVGDVSMAVGFATPVAGLQVYRPIEEPFGPMYNFVLRTRLPATTLERQIRAVVGAIDPDIVVSQLGDVPQVLENLANSSPVIPVLFAFAVAGLLIATIGLYGLMSQLMQQRRREIGVRLALGADYRRIITLMLGQSGRMVGVAVVVGLGGSLGIRMLLRHTMPGLPSLGWPALLGIGGILTLAALLASYLPSHRAARLNPVDVLRAE
ncbi:MAG TPA: ADOP family duplicated permease [Opitutaceae bacterium]|nr:ADOP family duplicated permease [Opitutaceae bacterium]